MSLCVKKKPNLYRLIGQKTANGPSDDGHSDSDSASSSCSGGDESEGKRERERAPGDDGPSGGDRGKEYLRFIGGQLLTGGIVSALVSVILTYKFSRLLEDKKEVYSNVIEKLSYAFESATFTSTEEYFPVPNVEVIKQLSTASFHRAFVPSYMLCGPRGVGKTTAMIMAFKGKKGVLRIQPDPVTVEKFYSALVGFGYLKETGLNPEKVVRGAFEAIKERGGGPPTLLIELNEKCTAKQLELLLVELKKIVTEDKLANCFIVASTSRASLLLPVTLGELRVKSYVLKDPSEELIKKYLDKQLSSVMQDTVARETLIDSYVQEIGTRFLDASWVCEFSPKYDTTPGETFLDRVATPEETFLDRVATLKQEKQDTFQDFVTMLNEAKIDKGKQKQIFEGIINETLRLSELTYAMKLSKEELLNKLASLHPHPVYINPNNQRLTIGNHVAGQEMKKYIKGI